MGFLASRIRSETSKLGCVILMVVVSILPHAEFGANEHREDAPHFMMELSTDYDACRYFYSILSSGRSLEFVFSIKWYHEIDGFVGESI